MSKVKVAYCMSRLLCQLLETELSLWLVLDYGTVCHITLSRVTHCHISVVDSKHFYLDSHILLFCF